MNRKILAILLITMIFLTVVPQVEATRNIFNNFTKLYNVPNVSDAKLNTCRTCMATISPNATLNKYGLDMRSNPAFDRNNSIQAMRNIEPLDSDGDKFTNIDEIHNSTLPGNESDFPMVSTPVKTMVTPTQTQTPTGTETKPAFTIMNGFVTIIIFAIVYFFAIRKRD